VHEVVDRKPQGAFLAFWAAASAPDLVGPIIAVDGVPLLPELGDPSAMPEGMAESADQVRAFYATLTPEQMQAQARGDDRAFARLVDATRSGVSSVALVIVRDPELSRDVAPGVYLAVWQDLSRLRQATSFLP
jgi:pimeloyl-ACP methyl ester carboxylesterase